MKKFLKILIIIIGIVFLIFAALICIGLFVDYDDHIENGRYTYVPEDDNKDNAYVEFNLSDYDKKDSELIYYSSVEEAILNSPLNAENEEFSVPEDFLNHVDEILHIWNGKQYDTIFYRAGSDNDPVQGFVMARCKKQVEEATVQYLLKSKKTCPEETVYQIGTLDNHVPPELLIEIVTEFMEIVNERFGSHVHILNWALHLDESTPHIHERHVFDCENQYGEIAPQQEKALEALGFELPEPEKPVGRKNNRKMTFDSACRVLLFDVAKKHGLQLEEEPEYGGRAYLEKQEYILFKQKEQLAAQEQKLEELTMKIEDVEALVDEVADIAYDKAVEVVTDTVKLETHKEDIKLVEQSKAWVLSPERKASKKEVEYAVKRLDGVIARITNAMKSTIQKIQTTLMKPEVKKAGTEQIKKKAKSSIIEQLSRKKKEIAEREVSRTLPAKSKKQDMEL